MFEFLNYLNSRHIVANFQNNFNIEATFNESFTTAPRNETANTSSNTTTTATTTTMTNLNRLRNTNTNSTNSAAQSATNGAANGTSSKKNGVKRAATRKSEEKKEMSSGSNSSSCDDSEGDCGGVDGSKKTRHRKQLSNVRTDHSEHLRYGWSSLVFIVARTSIRTPCANATPITDSSSEKAKYEENFTNNMKKISEENLELKASLNQSTKKNEQLVKK